MTLEVFAATESSQLFLYGNTPCFRLTLDQKHIHTRRSIAVRTMLVTHQLICITLLIGSASASAQSIRNAAPVSAGYAMQSNSLASVTVNAIDPGFRRIWRVRLDALGSVHSASLTSNPSASTILFDDELGSRLIRGDGREGDDDYNRGGNRGRDRDRDKHHNPAPTPVPEPATALLVGTTLLIAGRVLRRRRSMKTLPVGICPESRSFGGRHRS